MSVRNKNQCEVSVWEFVLSLWPWFIFPVSCLGMRWNFFLSIKKKFLFFVSRLSLLSNRKFDNSQIRIIVILLLLLSPSVSAAFWRPAALRPSFDRSSFGFCQSDSACLIDRAFNATLEGEVESFFTGGINPAKKPRCINSGQFVLDYYCDNAVWSSRTKFIALQLLDLAEQKSPEDFVLFCDDVRNTANNVLYSAGDAGIVDLVSSSCRPFGSETDFPCVNNFCVLNYGNKIAFGASVNLNIDDSQKSFLKSFNLPESACNNALTSMNFEECSHSPQSAKLFYNSKFQSIIYVPADSLGIFSVSVLFEKYILVPFRKIFNYAEKASSEISLHKLLNGTGLYNNIFISKKGSKSIFAFMERRVDSPVVDYIGLRFENINIGENPCLAFFKPFDSAIVCDAQLANESAYVPDEFYLVHSKSTSLVELWKYLTAKLRPE